MRVVEIVSPGPQGPPGPSGASGVWIREEPAGDIDGINGVFITSFNYTPGQILVYLNGLAQSVPEDYNETGGSEITMVEAPYVGDRLIVVYAKEE